VRHVADSLQRRVPGRAFGYAAAGPELDLGDRPVRDVELMTPWVLEREV